MEKGSSSTNTGEEEEIDGARNKEHKEKSQIDAPPPSEITPESQITNEKST
ncbi:hypothetical protein A2U01_0084050, partial [Trifolium medium]|nr:hypothetical protein [Trifolium medium]